METTAECQSDLKALQPGNTGSRLDLKPLQCCDVCDITMTLCPLKTNMCELESNLASQLRSVVTEQDVCTSCEGPGVKGQAVKVSGKSVQNS